VPQAIFRLKRAAGIEVANIHLEAALEVIWVHVLCPTIPRLLFQRSPDEIQPDLVEVEAKLVRT
jgi:hypothetical protein